jgi:hypothetical protein
MKLVQPSQAYGREKSGSQKENLPDFYPLNKIFCVTKFPKLSLGSRQKYFPICRFLVTFTYFWYFQIPYCMYCLPFKFISPNFCPNFSVYNLHDFILTGGRDCLPPLARTAIISRCYGSVIYCIKNILTLLFLMTCADSRLFTLDRLSAFTLDRLSTFYSRLSTFYSRLSTFTLDSRLLLSTLDF